jgi:uncharacterized protein (DUF58 family)
VSFSDKVHTLVKAASGRGHFRACREAIYGLEGRRVSPDFAELFTAIQLKLHRRALLVFLTALDDPLLAESFVTEVGLIARRHLVLVNVLETEGVRPLFARPPGATDEAMAEDLAGQLGWNRLVAVEGQLRRAGVQLAVLRREELDTELSRRYLEVKRRQML